MPQRLVLLLLAAQPLLAAQEIPAIYPQARLRLQAPAYWDTNPDPFVLKGYRAFWSHPRTGWITGTAQHMGPDHLRLYNTQTQAPLSLALHTIQRIEISRGKVRWGTTAAWAGAGLGGILGSLYTYRNLDCKGSICATQNLYLGALVFGIPTALLGGTIGRFIVTERWVRLPRPWPWTPNPPTAPVLPPVQRSPHQFSLDTTSLFNWTVAYVHRLTTAFALSGAFGYAFEDNRHSFNRNIWDTIEGTLLVRYQPNDIVQLDLGGTLLAFSPHDDENDRGYFSGLYTDILVGYRHLFLGPRLRLGRATDYRGSEWGILVNPLVVRLVFRR